MFEIPFLFDIILPVATSASVFLGLTGGLWFLQRKGLLKVAPWFWVVNAFVAVLAYPATISIVAFFGLWGCNLACHPFVEQVWYRYGYAAFLLWGVWFLFALRWHGLEIKEKRCCLTAMNFLFGLILITEVMAQWNFNWTAYTYFDEWNTHCVGESVSPDGRFRIIVTAVYSGHGLDCAAMNQYLGLGVCRRLMGSDSYSGPHVFRWSNDSNRFVCYEASGTSYPVALYDMETRKGLYPPTPVPPGYDDEFLSYGIDP